MQPDNLILDIEQHIEINAAIGDVFEGLLDHLGAKNTTPDQQPMPMCLERWPGGRWFRDLGNNAGHLWGFVQVIKPPALLELYGPMFMSYPVSGHLRLSLKEMASKTGLSLRHRALGLIEKEHREGVTHGWQHYLNCIKRDCE